MYNNVVKDQKALQMGLIAQNILFLVQGGPCPVSLYGQIVNFKTMKE